MPTPLLTTKLYRPPPRQDAVPRPDLIARLDAGLYRRLTLVAAPAGFGKTTLVGGWLDELERPAAWLSLDEGDADPHRFLAYLVAALRTVEPSIGGGALAGLEASPPPVEVLLPTLINDLAALPEPIALVLDDLHAAASEPVVAALSFLLDRLPPTLHLIATTRDLPALPLGRLRARDQLTELSADDLRFDAAESAAFLTRAMGLELEPDDVALLGARTEGWVAGLQLAAISLRGRDDPAALLRGAGGDRLALDFLLEEVLERQPEVVQAFLLATSVLERLCGPLCEALLDRPLSGQGTLEALERANLFVVPLDDARRWYRYHHLFGALLRERLERREPGAAAGLHARASRWFEAEGFAMEAFRHAAAAGDVGRAADLVEGGEVPLVFLAEVGPVLDWLASLAASAFEARPSLWVTYAAAETIGSRPLAGIEARLRTAERALAASEPSAATRDLSGYIATLRAMLAIPAMDVERMLTESRRALERLRPDALAQRTSATWTLGLAHQIRGERVEASAAFAEAIANSRTSGNRTVTIAATTCLAQLRESDLELPQATESYREVLRLTGDPPLPVSCEAFLGLARLHHLWNELDEAERLARRALALAHRVGTIDTPATCGALLARLRLARGDAEGAEALLDEAEGFLRRRGSIHALPEVAAVRAIVHLRRGELAAAARLTEAFELPLERARVALARGDAREAAALLAPLRERAAAAGHADERLAATTVEAVALDALGDTEGAHGRLAAALALTEPGGIVRPFLDEGAPMAALLARSGAVRGSPWVATLLRAFDAAGIESAHGAPAASADPLIEPLTPRELEVLRLIAEGLSNDEIGERLGLALSTVKGHNQNLFGKLLVRRRTEAIARARELGLL